VTIPGFSCAERPQSAQDVAAAALIRSPISQVELLALGGAIARVDADATALSFRQARWLINIPAADAYGRTLERLRHVKAIYDPDNLFRLNQNIQPAPASTAKTAVA
jgi:hypothetical protein